VKKKSALIACLLALAMGALAADAKRVLPKRDMRTNPPGKFLSPGYYVPQILNGEIVSIDCGDGYKLSGDFIKRRKVRNALPGVLFLHEAGKTRRSWYPMTVQEAGRGFVSLAVDLRGCGENPGQNGANNKTLDQLPEADRAKMLEDVRNALSYLATNPATDGENIGIIGSGLGANLALAAAAEPWGKNVKVVIAISPSLNDRGYRADEAAKNMGRTMVCLAAAQGNTTEYQAASSIYGILSGPKDFYQAEGSGSGVGLYGTKRAVAGKGDNKDTVFFSQIQLWLFRGLTDKLPALPPARKTPKR